MRTGGRGGFTPGCVHPSVPCNSSTPSEMEIKASSLVVVGIDVLGIAPFATTYPGQFLMGSPHIHCRLVFGCGPVSLFNSRLQVFKDSGS